MNGSGPDNSETTELDTPEDVIQFLDANNSLLPDDGLRIKRIRHDAEKWEIGDGEFSFQIERHRSPLPSYMKSPTGKMSARWHILKRYRYDLKSDDWAVEILDKTFHYDRHLLIQAEFEKLDSKVMWDKKAHRVQNSADPQATLEQEFTPIEQEYQTRFEEVPQKQSEQMINILKQEFRKQAGLD